MLEKSFLRMWLRKIIKKSHLLIKIREKIILLKNIKNYTLSLT